MTLIDNLTNNADQTTQVVLDDGSILQIDFLYNAATERWTMNISHPTLTVNGINLCVHPNLLREWRNVINFGFACTTTDGLDPITINDFVNGNAQVYALNEADVIDVEATIMGGVLQ